MQLTLNALLAVDVLALLVDSTQHLILDSSTVANILWQQQQQYKSGTKSYNSAAKATALQQKTLPQGQGPCSLGDAPLTVVGLGCIPISILIFFGVLTLRQLEGRCTMCFLDTDDCLDTL